METNSFNVHYNQLTFDAFDGRRNIRRHDDESVNALAKSFAMFGQQQPIKVAWNKKAVAEGEGKHYVVTSGHGRSQAVKLLAEVGIPVSEFQEWLDAGHKLAKNVRIENDTVFGDGTIRVEEYRPRNAQESLLLRGAENLIRKEMSPSEISSFITELVDEQHLSPETVGELYSMSPDEVEKYLWIQRLPENERERLDAGKTSVSALRLRYSAKGNLKRSYRKNKVRKNEVRRLQRKDVDEMAEVIANADVTDEQREALEAVIAYLRKETDTLEFASVEETELV